MIESISNHAETDPDEKTAVDFRSDSKVWTAGFFIAFVFLIVCFYRGIHVPWVENDNYYGAIYAQAAHNNLRVGVLATGGVPATLYFGPLPIPVDAYYVHHPTLLPLLVTASFAMFGEAEWAARLVPVLCSLLSMIFLWLFVRDAVNRRAATLSAAVFATLPMELHYGDMVDFEPCLVMLMLAALLCLRYWLTRDRAFWMWLAGVCCFLAVWMDWPGYLFVLSLVAWLLWKWKKGAPRKFAGFALALLGICGVSGMVFLLQIRHVNPDAWSDLWTALTMRLGNGVATGSSASGQGSDVHFTFAEWCRTIARGIRADYTIPSLALAALGAALIGLKSTGGFRRAGWGAWHMIVAGVLYVVILRNESFIHDFCAFYLIGSIAILAGLALEGVLDWIEKWASAKFLQPMLALVVLVPVGWLAWNGVTQAQKLRSPFYMLDGVTAEPQNLIPDLGKKLAQSFSPETTILCNFDPYTSVLPYYAQRTVRNNLTAFEYWKDVMAEEQGPFGGILWLDAPEASEVLTAIPPNELVPFELDGFRFALWRPAR